MLDSPPPTTVRTWWGLVVLLLPALLVSMDISILFTAGPAIAADLSPTAAELLWMMDSYSFVLAGLLVTMGALGDRIGRRRLLMCGALVFGAASLALGLARSPELFIAGRVLLGVGAATLAPSTLALIRGMFADDGRRRTAVAAWTVAFTGGAVAGPVLGGLLLERFAWNAVFLVNLPVMALLLVAALLLVPESRDPRPTRFDVVGALLSLAAVLGLVHSAKRFADHGPDAGGVAGLLVGLLLLVLFVRRQWRAVHPFLDLALFGSPAFSVAAVTGTVASVAMVGTGLLAFTSLQTVHGMSPLGAALAALPTFAGAALGAAVAAALARRIQPGSLVVTGLLVGAVGMVAIGGPAAGTEPVGFIAGYTILTAGIGAVGTTANSMILGAAPAGRAGAAASISETGVALGDALGIAAFGTVSAFVYREQMRAAGLPGVPAEAVDTVGGAVAAAATRTAAEGEALRGAAFDAFTTSLTVVALVGAALLVVTALAAALVLRGDRIPVGNGPEPGR